MSKILLDYVGIYGVVNIKWSLACLTMLYCFTIKTSYLKNQLIIILTIQWLRVVDGGLGSVAWDFCAAASLALPLSLLLTA